MIVVWCANPADAAEHFGPVLGGSGVPTRYVHLEEAPETKPEDVLLVCGAAGLKTLQRAKVCPGNLGLGKLRGREFTAPSGAAVLTTYDPWLRFREVAMGQEVLWDARLAIRLHLTGSLEPEVGDYHWGSVSEVRTRVRERLDAGATFVRLALDLETMGKYPWYEAKRIVSSQWTLDPGEATCVYHLDYGGPAGVVDGLIPPIGFETWDEYEAARWLLTEPRVRLCGAGLKYDLVWVREKWGIACENFRLDTLLVGSLLDENRSNSLNWHAKTLTTMGGYDDSFSRTHDKGHMEAVPKDELLVYAGGDSDATMRTALRFSEELAGLPAITRLYNRIIHPAARAFEDVERLGLLADREGFVALAEELKVVIAEREKEALEAIPQRIRARYIDNLKITRPVVVRDAFFSKDGGWGLKPIDRTATTKQPSTAASHLRKFDHHPGARRFNEAFGAMARAKKTLSTWVEGFLYDLRPDGYFHPTYALHHGALYDDPDEDDTGTVTGRLTAKNPSVQTIPKRTEWTKRLRANYPAPDGYLFWQGDFSQGELRVVACVAPEPAMIEVYKRGEDLHVKTAAETMKIEPAELLAWRKSDPARYELMRSRGKAGNFGLVYGMRAPGFVVYAKNSYDVEFSLAEATAFRDSFLNELYPGLPAYHERQEETVKAQGWVESPLGRRRRLPLVWSPDRDMASRAVLQAINSPVQSTLNDVCLLLLVELADEFRGEEEVFSVRGSSHDALYGYVRVDMADECLARADARARGLRAILADEFGWETEIPFPVDWEIGPSWGSLEEYRLAA